MRHFRKSVTFTYTQQWPQSIESLSLLKDVLLSYLAFFYYIYHGWDMLIAMMERGDPKFNTFNLIKEITMTLEDLYKITRLPIRGKLVNMALVLNTKQVEEWAIWLIGSYEVNHKKSGVFLM